MVGGRVVDGDLFALTGGTVRHLDHPVREATADDDDRGNANQLRIGEFDAGAGGTVVEDHPHTGGVELRGQPLPAFEQFVAFAGDDDVHIGRCHRTGPDDARFVVVLFDDRGDQPGHADAVGTHGDPGGFAVRAERVHLERVRVFPAELENVADLDAARGNQCAFAVRRGVPFAYVGGFDGAVRGEVPAAHQIHHVVVRFVGAGDPGGAGDDARVDEEPHAVRGERARPDVALHQERVVREVLVLDECDLGRFQRRLETFHVDVPVAGDTDAEQVPFLLAGF